MWHRLEFRSTREANDYADKRARDGYGTYLGDVDRYLTRVIVEDPAFCAGYPMTRPLRILCVDIEQRTDGSGFPPRDAPMVSIALLAMEGDELHDSVVVADEGPDGEPNDAAVVEAWRYAVQGFDPDIIVGYNVHYDVGVLAARSAIHGYPLEQWGRHDDNGERARSLSRSEFNGRFRNEVYYAGGRIIWDLQANANPISDYNLSGVKDQKLKTIAGFLGWPVIEEDTKDTLSLWRHRKLDLVRYNRNDTDLVRRMVERYLPDRIRMAEFFGAPLDATIDVRSGWPGTIAAATALYQSGIVSDGKNVERHRQWLRKKTRRGAHSDDDEDGGDWVKPQGAHVQLHKRGLFQPVYKVDFASLYPNVIVAVGCGPDNTRIIGTSTLGDFAVHQDGEVRIVSIPDENYGHNWLIEIRGASPFTDTVRARMEERLAAKYAGDETRAAILKTLLNSLCFGVQGALGNRYGVLPLLIIATGVSRLLIASVENAVGDAAIETDTDGVYVTRKFLTPVLNRAANAEVQRLGFEPRFTLDQDEFHAGWFHEAKQYIVLDPKGKFKRYGGAMKGSAHPGVFDHVVENVGRTLLTDGRDAALVVAKQCIDLSTYEPKQFVQRSRLSKPVEAYAHESKEVKIARAYEALYGIPPTPGRTYEYIRTRRGRVPPTPQAFKELDEWAYLNGVILTALSRLGFDDLEELGLKDRVTTVQARSKRPAAETDLSRFMR